MVLYPNIFMEVNIAILTVTDTRTIDNDKSGAILVKKIAEQNHKLVDRKIVKDEKEDIKKIILEWTNNNEIDVIITTGGTGLTGRDIAPEALNEIALDAASVSGFYFDIDFSFRQSFGIGSKWCL